MSQAIQICEACIEDLPQIQKLAHAIWRTCYPGIITAGQIEYMLERDYNLETLEREITEEGICFERLIIDVESIGFASHGPTDRPGEIKIHKLYVHQEHQRQGYGGRLLEHIATRSSSEGISTLVLAVNKQNIQAVNAYRKYGFRQREAVVVDIGSGYVMDDFILEKPL